MRLIAIATSLILLLMSPQAGAQEQKLHSQARLFSMLRNSGEGAIVPLAVEITMEAGWKTYWRTAGDAGLAPVFDWTGSKNIASAKTLWPAPHRYILADLDNFGYKDRVIFPIDATIAQPGEEIVAELKLDILVCADVCVPETHKLSLTLPKGPLRLSDDANLLSASYNDLPMTEMEGFAFQESHLAFDRENRHYLVITAKSDLPPSVEADLFIEQNAGIVFGKPEISYDAASGIITFKALSHSTDTQEGLIKSLSEGPITVTYTDGLAIEGQTPFNPRVSSEVPKEESLPQKVGGALDPRILLLALLGGLILNLMPCVLPVLSLKVLSVVSHGGTDSRKDILRNFMASAAGILFSFWLMAGSLVALKSAGESVGWGIQFQHPAFLIFLIALLLGFAANLWGLFEIHLPRFVAHHVGGKQAHDEPTLAGHFLTGAFATLLATPCTAPFLGTAIGFALARGSFEIFTIFTAVGLGLALPYIALAFSPGLFRHMPRPGQWMVKLKKILSVALLITAIWLGSVMVTIFTAPAIDPGWEKFDASRIAPAVRDGKTVIVDVSADWCLTCKANKKFVLEQDTITEALSAPNILKLQADWTQRDPAIAAYLQSFGRYGIPFNVVYGPGNSKGIPLPELLTQQAILDALAEAAGE